MIQELVDRFEKQKKNVREEFKKNFPGTYTDIVLGILKAIEVDPYMTQHCLDPTRIHVIDDGDYQGTLLYVIAEKGYQPSKYYAVYVGYGSCSGCDSLQAIRGFDEEVDDEMLDSLMGIAETICRGIVEIGY